MPFLLPALIALILAEVALGFMLLWIGQWLYRRLFRRWDLSLELFVRDNVAVAIALVGFYLGIVLALAGVLDKQGNTWQERLLNLAIYGASVIGLMLLGAGLGDRLILRRCDAAREIQEEQNIGAAAVEAALHVANGLILSTAMGGESGNWRVGIVCWLIGWSAIALVSQTYSRLAGFNLYAEIRNRNNPAVGVAFAGLLVATGNVVRVAFIPEFVSWQQSLPQYVLVMMLCVAILGAIRWLADLLLVPGVRITDETVHQEIPNLGVGFIEAFSYIAGSFLIAWSF